MNTIPDPAGPPPAAHPRERARAELEVAQAARRAFGVLLGQVDDRELFARVCGAEWIARAEAELAVLAGRCAGEPALLALDAGRLTVWLPGGDLPALHSLGDGLREAFEALEWPHGARTLRLRVRLGLATSAAAEPAFDPRLVLELLEGVAAEGLRVALEGGGEVVHTEIYGFLQRGLERREPELLAQQARRVAARSSALEAEQAARLAARPAAPPPAPEPTSGASGERPAGARVAPGPARLVPRPAPPRSGPVPAPAALPADDLPPAAPDPLCATLGERLAHAVRELLRGAGGRSDPAVERELGALVEARLEEERLLARAELGKSYGRQVDLLERRLAKLQAALEETEARVQRRERTASDPGLASVYRTVQGLAPDDSRFEQKLELMQQIFLANLALARSRARLPEAS